MICRHPSLPWLLICSALVLALVGSVQAAEPRADAKTILPVGTASTVRVAAIQLRVVPDHLDWTYAVGEPAKFRLQVLADNEPVTGLVVRYRVGPELQPVEQKSVTVPAEGATIDAGTMKEPGFIKCVATVQFEGRNYRAVGTAGFSPDQIQPTQTNPEDFDAFWAAGKAELAKIPLDSKLTLQPDLCTSEVDVYHVSFQNVHGGTSQITRIYGMLCIPKGNGPFPAVLCVPPAGVRQFSGNRELAAQGVITLEIGIHGIPVNLPPEIYEKLRYGALGGYQTFHLDDREQYYYRRVFLGCVRANDFLCSLPKFDGKNLAVTGGSQGGHLTVVTAALDPRVTALAAGNVAYCDVTGDLHGRPGGSPHPFRNEKDGHRTPLKIATSAYYDTVNFAKRLKAPGFYTWAYNDETCPPTSTFAAFNVITAPKQLVLALELGHVIGPEQTDRMTRWLLTSLGVKPTKVNFQDESFRTDIQRDR